MAGRVVACLLIGALVMLSTGCGGGSSATAGSSAAQSRPPGEPSSQFFGKSAANHFSKFGSESTVEELEAAGAIVAKSLKARSSHDWAGQCATLSKKIIKAVETNPAATKGQGCAKNLGAQGKTAPKEILEDNLKGAVVALRVKGSKGYALFHGTDKKDWAMLMEKEGGDWKVASLIAEEIQY